MSEALSDIIRLFRMNVDVYHNAQACGNWLFSEHSLGDTCFHMVTKGECRLDVPGHMSTQLNVGDLVIFPREIPHTMGPIGEASGPELVLPFDQAGDIPGTGMLCGQARFDHQGSAHLLDALPTVFIVPFNREHEWLCSLIHLIIKESENPGLASSAIVDRLSELLFVYALRQYLLDHRDRQGILALFADGRMAKATSAIHEAPDKDWTLDLLAKKSGMSRTSFAETFRRISGWTPVKYLTWWRMQLAWGKLSEGQTSAGVADQVGYRSEAAFSRAFLKQFGVSAGKVRRRKGKSQKMGQKTEI